MIFSLEKKDPPHHENKVLVQNNEWTLVKV